VKLPGFVHQWLRHPQRPVDSRPADPETLWQALVERQARVPQPAAVNVDACQAWLESRLQWLRVDGRRELPVVLGESACTALQQWQAALGRGELLRDAVRQLLGCGGLQMSDPFGGAAWTLIDSMATPEASNLLRFARGQETLLVLQSVTSFDVLLFPAYGLALRNGHGNLRHLASLLASSAPEPSVLAWPQTPRRFGGLQIGHGRPGHYFYNAVPALEDIADLLGSGQGALWSHRFAHFVALDVVYGFTPPLRVWKQDELNQHCRKHAESTFLLGRIHRRGADDGVEGFDRRLRAVLPQLVDAVFQREVTAVLGGRSRVLWFGVTGQKRRWLEQEEGIAAIIDHFRACHPDLAVVFDGWTCTLDQDPERTVAVAEDRQVAERIVARLARPVPWLSTIGMDPARKVFVAGHVDAFLANHTTGSLHVSRLAQRPGVTHSSAAVGTAGHRHPNVIRVPQNAVSDCPRGDEPRKDFIDYRFDWRIACTLLAQQLASAKPMH